MEIFRRAWRWVRANPGWTAGGATAVVTTAAAVTIRARRNKPSKQPSGGGPEGTGWGITGGFGGSNTPVTPKPTTYSESVPPAIPIPPQRLPPNGDGQTVHEGSRVVLRGDTWNCRRGAKQPLGRYDELVPSQVIAAGGPIAQAIDTGISFVRDVMSEIGPRRVCTVTGGVYVPLAIVQASQVQASVLVTVGYGSESAWWGDGSAWWWQYVGTRSDTGPLISGATGPGTGSSHDPGPKAAYLRTGDRPPGSLWPHVQIGRWQASLPGPLLVPQAEIVRSGNDLTLGVWLPPRASLSHLTAWGKRVIDADVRWLVGWELRTIA